ncbi:MAG: MATE family efflux transporter [bacterium]
MPPVGRSGLDDGIIGIAAGSRSVRESYLVHGISSRKWGPVRGDSSEYAVMNKRQQSTARNRPQPPRQSGLGAALQIQHGREILALATPTVMTMLSHTLMWTVDTALLGRVSSLALGAAGLGGMMTWTGYSLFNNLSRISQTFVAQAHGKGDDEAVGHYSWQAIYIAIVCGLLLQIIGYGSYLILPLTRNAAEIQDLTYVYIKWRTVSAVFTQLTFALLGFYQGRRDVRTPMWAGIAANAANVVLDLWLIFGWSGLAIGHSRLLAMAPLGVKGAAIATSVGQGLNFAILALCILAKRHRRRYAMHRPRRPSWRRIRDIIRVGYPAAWENFIDMMAFTFFSVFIGRTGAVALASSQITIQLLAFSFMPMWGITIAGSVLTGNWIGAGQPKTAARYARQVYKLGLYYMLALALILVCLRTHVFAIFTNDPEVLILGVGLVMAAALFQIGDGLRMISVGILQGAGDTRFPMFTSLIILWGLFVPLTYLLVVQLGQGVAQAWRIGVLAYLLQAVVLYARFRSGKWQRIRIFSADRPGN